MPYDIKQVGDKYHVINQDTQEVVPGGEHTSQGEAEAHIKALYANVEDSSTIEKAEEVKGAAEAALDAPAVEAVPDSLPPAMEPGAPVEPLLEVSSPPAEMTPSVPLGKFSQFLPLVKIDEVQHRIWATGAREEPDYNHEIMDFESSVPEFERWSSLAYNRSGGKSYGNVRAMHKEIAAGKLFQFSVNRLNKSFDIGAEIVDPLEWEKVITGVYTGISVGGSYGRRWMDSQLPGYTRYTAVPIELSLVDVPAIPSALITVIKMDGSVERKELSVEDKPLQAKGTADLQKQLPSAPAATGEIPGIPGETVKKQPNSFSTAELTPGAEPTGSELESHHDSAVSISDVAALATQATPKEGVKKVAIAVKKALKKGDSSSAIDAARSQVGTLLAQAKNGEIDMDALAQLAATLDVGLDEAEDNPANTGGATGTNQSTDEVEKSETPSEAPTQTQYTGETESKPGTLPSPKNSETMSKGKKMEKNAEPLSTVPPIPNLILHGDDEEDMSRELPEFIQAMQRGKLGKAQHIAGDQIRFDKMVLASAKAIMDESGVNYRSIGRLHSNAPAELELQKALIASDVPGVWLIRLARLMLPLYAGIRRRIPTQTPQTGSNQATWRAMLGFSNVTFANMMSVAEAAVGDAMNESFLTFQTPYRDIAQNDAVTLKAIQAARGYDDPMQIAVIRTLTALLQGEERKLLGDNYAAIAAPTAVTATPANTGGSLAAATYTVKVSALTYRGDLNNTRGGGIGETEVTAASGAVVSGSGGGTVTASWASVPGAFAYNVYVYNGASEHFAEKVYVPLYVLKAFPGSGAAGPTSGSSANAYGYEGIAQWCMQSTIYGNAITGKITSTDLAGAGITAGNGGIPELDTVLGSLWKNWQIAPTLMIVSSTGIQTITGKLLSLNNAALYRIEVQEERGTIRGGAFVTGYVNKFAAFADGTPRYVDIMPHPYMPDGTMLILCESINYPMAREARGFALDVLLPYTYFPLAQNTIQYPFALTCSEVPECFHPSVQTAIQGIDWSK